MRFRNLNSIPPHIYSPNEGKMGDLESRLKNIPNDILNSLINTGLTDLYLLPFHPNKEVKKLFSEENFDYIKTIADAKKENLRAVRNYILIEILNKTGVDFETELYSNTKLDIIGILDENQQKKQIAEIFTSNPKPLMNKTRNNPIEQNILTKTIKKYTELANSQKTGTKVRLELGIFKGKLKNKLVYYQTKDKTDDSLRTSLTYEIFNAIKNSRNNNVEYKKELKKKLPNKKHQIELLSEEKKLENYFEQFFLNDYFAFEIGTAEYIREGEEPTLSGEIEVLRRKIEQNANIKVIEYKDEFHNSKKPRAKQYVLSIPKHIQKQILPFPELVHENYLRDLRVSVHLKPFFDTLKYHFGDKAHDMYKYRKKPEVFSKTLKSSEQKIYFNVLKTVERLI